MRLDQIYPEHSKALLDANLINPKKKKLPTMKTLWKRDKEDTNEISTYAKQAKKDTRNVYFAGALLIKGLKNGKIVG